MPDAIIQPTVTIRVYSPMAQNGVRQRDLSTYRSAQFTRQRNAVGTFEIVIPLMPITLDLLNEIREGWLFEFWSEAIRPAYLFGGFVTSLRWALEEGRSVLTVRGLSYLSWLSQRRIVGGTGSKDWIAKDLGVEGPVGGYKPSINRLMYLAMVTNPGAPAMPLSLSPPGTVREHPSFRIPTNESISHINDTFSVPLNPALGLLPEHAIPRPFDTSITAYLSGIEVMNYFSEQVGDSKNTNPSSSWFGMPRISYDIIRYDGASQAGWPTNALYFVIRVPGLGTNRTVGNQQGNQPVIFDVDGGGVAEGEYVEESAEIRNYIIALGAGEGPTRKLLPFLDQASIDRYGRVEEVVDGGQENDNNVLKQKADDVLNERRSAKSSAHFRLDVIPGQVFGTDFFFDDAVTVYWGDIGLVLNEFVTSVSLSMGGGDTGTIGIQRADVTVGSEKLVSPDSLGLLGRYLNGLKRGITNLRI